MPQHLVFSCILRSAREGSVGYVETHHLVLHPPSSSTPPDLSPIADHRIHFKLPRMVTIRRGSTDSFGRSDDLWKTHCEQICQNVNKLVNELCFREKCISSTPSTNKECEVDADGCSLEISLESNSAKGPSIPLDQITELVSKAFGVPNFDVSGNVSHLNPTERHKPVQLIVDRLNTSQKFAFFTNTSRCPTNWRLVGTGFAATCVPAQMANRNRTTHTYGHKARGRRPTWVNFPTTAVWIPEVSFGKLPDLQEIMNHLQPTETRLHAQMEAENLIKELRYLGFAEEELLLIICLSIMLAIFGSALTAIIFFAFFKPVRPPGLFQPIRRRNAVLSALYLVSKVTITILVLPLRIVRAIAKRFGDEAVYIRDSVRKSSLAGLLRESLNVYRQQMSIERIKDWRRRMILRDLLTELTVIRITEAGRIMRELESDDVSLSTGGVKRKTPPEFIPYIQLPRHYDVAFFLLHEDYWKRLEHVHFSYPAPPYPLAV
ncbi:unnamed protein product [Dicrocoelium dendriticum]|nr:unnamed protein product [Dicrocoelium dendriticum]